MFIKLGLWTELSNSHDKAFWAFESAFREGMILAKRMIIWLQGQHIPTLVGGETISCFTEVKINDVYNTLSLPQPNAPARS